MIFNQPPQFWTFWCVSFKETIINSTLSLKMNSQVPREFNAQPARRILSYECKNPNCGKLFANVFAYDQHRNHATTQGTLCASITMRNEITGLRRSDTSTAALSTRPSTGWTLRTCISHLTVSSTPLNSIVIARTLTEKVF